MKNWEIQHNCKRTTGLLKKHTSLPRLSAWHRLTNLCPHLTADKAALHILLFICIPTKENKLFKPLAPKLWPSQQSAEAGLIGIMLFDHQNLHLSPSLCVYRHQHWSALNSSAQKWESSIGKGVGGGGGVGVRAPESCSVLIKGPPRSPAVVNRAGERTGREA